MLKCFSPKGALFPVGLRDIRWCDPSAQVGTSCPSCLTTVANQRALPPQSSTTAAHPPLLARRPSRRTCTWPGVSTTPLLRPPHSPRWPGCAPCPRAYAPLASGSHTGYMPKVRALARAASVALAAAAALLGTGAGTGASAQTRTLPEAQAAPHAPALPARRPRPLPIFRGAQRHDVAAARHARVR